MVVWIMQLWRLLVGELNGGHSVHASTQSAKGTDTLGSEVESSDVQEPQGV